MLQRTILVGPPRGITGTKNRVSQRRVSTAVCTVERAHFVHWRSTWAMAFALVRTPIRKNMLHPLAETLASPDERNVALGGLWGCSTSVMVLWVGPWRSAFVHSPQGTQGFTEELQFDGILLSSLHSPAKFASVPSTALGVGGRTRRPSLDNLTLPGRFGRFGLLRSPMGTWLLL